MIVVWLFLMMPRVCLQFVIVVFPDHTHLLFLKQTILFFAFISFHINYLTLYMLLLSSVDFFKKKNFLKNCFQEHYQSVKWFTSILLVLIWVQTVCKGYQ